MIEVAPNLFVGNATDAEITHERLLELLHYDPTTGRFTWRVNRGGRAKKGTQAGSPDGGGYILINMYISGRRRTYKAHRLAWFYVYGQWPERSIDHKQRDHSDNRLDELREATQSQNNGNAVVRKDSQTGVKGVQLTPNGKYVAKIKKEGVRHHLGTFANIESASRAYAEAARRLFGDFARAA